MNQIIETSSIFIGLIGAVIIGILFHNQSCLIDLKKELEIGLRGFRNGIRSLCQENSAIFLGKDISEEQKINIKTLREKMSDQNFDWGNKKNYDEIFSQAQELGNSYSAIKGQCHFLKTRFPDYYEYNKKRMPRVVIYGLFLELYLVFIGIICPLIKLFCDRIENYLIIFGIIFISIWIVRVLSFLKDENKIKVVWDF